MVGKMFVRILDERKTPIKNLYLFASARSAGKKIDYNGQSLEIEEFTPEAFDREIDIALFAVDTGFSKVNAPIFAKKGCVVVDNSSAWRLDPEVPLVVPEVNGDDIKNNKGIIANPNCVTVPAVVVMKPLHDKYNIKRVIYSSYQSVSGAGQGGFTDLEEGLKGSPPKKFPFPIANNILPHIDTFRDNGYTGEEVKIIEETKKILSDQSIKVTATAVRVPVFVGHSISLNVEFEKGFEIDDLIQTLRNADGIIVQNDITDDKTPYPMPINAAGRDDVFVGRIRRDLSADNGVNLWVVADNTRKGAATNAVQIMEILLKGMD
jgi:aspartate-semialdehyde dehydrogenase